MTKILIATITILLSQSVFGQNSLDSVNIEDVKTFTAIKDQTPYLAWSKDEEQDGKIALARANAICKSIGYDIDKPQRSLRMLRAAI